MLNLIEKIHALMVSPRISIWHYIAAKDNNAFVYWKIDDFGKSEPFKFNSLEAMIEQAYSEIDPLLVPLPEKIEAPEEV